MLAVVGVLAIRPEWRLPALAFAILAIPGNVDDLLPQLQLDPHQIRDANAPIVSVVDLLIGWALVLTLREGRRPDGTIGRLVILGLGLAVVGWFATAAAVAAGADPAAGLRGALLLARIPAFLYLGGALRRELGDGSLLAAAVVAGGIVLLGNGLYTTISAELERFTAKTFGRNGFAIALTLVVVVATAGTYRWWSLVRDPDVRRRVAIAIPIVVGGLCLFGAAATGTRMAALVLIAVAIAAVILDPARLSRRSLGGLAATAGLAFAILGASVVLTTAGGRTVSVITDPDTTVDIVTDPGSVPSETEVRSRGQFWDLAVAMARDRPLTGVGPFQWNHVRYELDPEGPVVVADAHQTYLQLAAEFGVPVAALYVVLLAAAGLLALWSMRDLGRRRAIGWAAIGIVIGAAVFPLADVTNSHLFNIRNGAIAWLMIGAALGLCRAAAERGPARSGAGPETLRPIG